MLERAGISIFRATVQPRSRSVAPAAAANVLENGISTAIRIHAPRANGWDLVWAQGDLGAPRVPISHRGAPRPPEQGRCALDRDRGRNAHRAGLCARRRCKMAAGTVRNIWQPLSAAPRPGAPFNCAREDTSGTRKNSRGVRPRPAHAAEPPAAPHLHGHFAKLPRANSRSAYRRATSCVPVACARLQ